MGMEYLPGGSLHDFIRRRFSKGKKFSDKEAALIMTGILNAVDYIHANSVIHRDLKP